MARIKIVFTFSLFIVTLMLFCCTSFSDSWINPPPPNMQFKDEKIEILFVLESRFDEAKKALQNTDFSLLDAYTFEYYTGIKYNSDKSPYLIRSTIFAYNKNGFNASCNGNNEILIEHIVLSNSKRIKNWPVILLLEMKPIKVWNNCYSAK